MATAPKQSLVGKSLFRLTPSACHPYIELARLDRPIGIYLVLWPTLWALWIAGQGAPSAHNILIFSLGALVMRSAGCVINDYADRNIDGYVERTKLRPLARGAVSERNALIYFVSLCLIALGLVLMTNMLTIMLSVGGVLLAAIYPFMKRHTYLPQVFLGAAFAWAVPMAFAAQAAEIDRVYQLYPSLNDDKFVRDNLEKWLS